MFLKSAGVYVAGMCFIHIALCGVAEAAEQGGTCGGFIGISCGAGRWCDPLAGKCGGADIQGRCVEVSTPCSKQRSTAGAVCGCDGKTYPNDCERQRANVPKNHNGECR